MMKTSRVIHTLAVTSLLAVIGNMLATACFAQDDFRRYINKYDFKNVLVLGVDADEREALEYMKKYDFDLVIPISREGNKVEDSVRATLEKLGIPTGGLAQLKGKSIENLYAHSWGSSRAINTISVDGTIKVTNLHALGSPHSTISGLPETLERGLIQKVYFHINEGDWISELRHFPSGLTGKFTSKIEFHFYRTEQRETNTVHKEPASIPLFNAPLGFDHYYHYNSPEVGHGLAGSYFRNMDTALSNDPKNSPFKNAPPPFRAYSVPNYWTNEGIGKQMGQTMAEARILTEMARDKKKAIIVGTGTAADLMYKNMVGNPRVEDVKRIYSNPGDNQLQRAAKEFGADVILGVKQGGVVASTTGPGMRGGRGGGITRPPSWFPPPNRNPPPTNRPQLGGPPPRPQEGQAGISRTDFRSLTSTNDIGGVMLQGAASVGGAESQLASGNFSVIFENSSAGVDIGKLRKFVTGLWAVYFGKEGPGISIDPIAPGVNKHLVRYIGQVINSDLGRVMREADYTMKKWAVGTEKPEIQRFKSVDALSATHGIQYLGASRRFWFVPEDMRFKLMGDALLFESGKMTLKTEYVFLNKETKAEPADEAFARFFTEHYTEIADKYPIYKELFEYAKLVSLARYLKEKGIPMLWFLLANKDMVITEDSPGTVDAFAKKSDYFQYVEIEGGVDLAVKPPAGNYVIDQAAAQAIGEALKRYGARQSQGSFAVPAENIRVESGKGDFTLTGSQALALSRGTASGEKYQTDLALRRDNEPGLELVRYYDPEYEGLTDFGKGWHLLIPYQVAPHGEKKIEFLNARIPEKMIVRNLLTGREEILTFSKDRYSIAGYVPDRLEMSNLIGLFLLSDASFRLADKLGNEFQFDQGGQMTEMIITDDYHVKFEYGTEKASKEVFARSPYRIEPVGTEREAVLNVMLPKQLKLVQAENGKEELFVLNRDNKYNIVGYTPVDKDSRYMILAVMSDASFVLHDKQENQIAFDPAGGFDQITASVMKGLSQGDHEIKLDYEFNAGQFRIREARVMRKGLTTTVYAAKYEYGQDGRLSKVILPTGQEVAITYDQERVMVAGR